MLDAMEKIAVFAGSFSPFTKGHEDIVEKALPLFDKLVIAVGHNFNKKDAFSLDERLQWIRQIYMDNPKVEVMSYQGLTTDLCHQVGARFMVRGIRNASDYAVEQEMAIVNHSLASDIQTVFLPCSPHLASVSSSLVRELWSLHVDYSRFLSYQLPEHP